jgi:hypothetical protein
VADTTTITAGGDVIKLVEGAIAGFAAGKGFSLSPDEIGKLVTDCVAWIANHVTDGVKAKAAADANAAADKITSLETAEAAQEKL